MKFFCSFLFLVVFLTTAIAAAHPLLMYTHDFSEDVDSLDDFRSVKSEDCPLSLNEKNQLRKNGYFQIIEKKKIIDKIIPIEIQEQSKILEVRLLGKILYKKSYYEVIKINSSSDFLMIFIILIIIPFLILSLLGLYRIIIYEVTKKLLFHNIFYSIIVIISFVVGQLFDPLFLFLLLFLNIFLSKKYLGKGGVLIGIVCTISGGSTLFFNFGIEAIIAYIVVILSFSLFSYFFQRVYIRFNISSSKKN